MKNATTTRCGLPGMTAAAVAAFNLPGWRPAFAATPPGHLKLLFWQGVPSLNPHFAIAPKDQEGGRLFYQPLAGRNSDGDLVPCLADGIPSVENGLLAADATSIV